MRILHGFAGGFIAAMLVIAGTHAGAAEDLMIVSSERDGIYLNPTNRRFRYQDLVLHNVGVKNTGDRVLTVETLRIDLLAAGEVQLSSYVPVATLVSDTRQLAGNPLPIFNAFQLLATGGVADFFEEETTLATGPAIAAGEGLVSSGHHFSVGFAPDAVRITVEALAERGGRQTASLDVPVVEAPTTIRYRSPVKGTWFMRALPGVESHHRLNAATEFAVDFFKLDREGRAVVGDRVDTNNYPGYGQPVFAAAAGVVVHVESTAVQDRSAFLPREGESPKDRGRRLQDMMMQAFQENARRAAGGNLVTIRHEVDGYAEYSSYGHLKSGSILVQAGDVVESGQQIAAVGDTGDSPEVHLHFQVNAAPDAFTSKSIPFSFEGVQHAVRPPEPGLMIRVRD